MVLEASPCKLDASYPLPITPFPSPSPPCTHSSVLMCAHTPPWLIQAHSVLLVASVSARGRMLWHHFFFVFFPPCGNIPHRCKVILTFGEKDPLLATQCVLSHFKLKEAMWIHCARVFVWYLLAQWELKANPCLHLSFALQSHPWPPPLTDLLCHSPSGLSLLTWFPLCPWSPLSISALSPSLSFFVCVCQPDVVHVLAHCMMEPEELSEAVQCSLVVRRRLPDVELSL